MPKRRLENWISSYLDYSSHSEAPQVFHFWTAISVLSGAVRRQVWIDQKYFDWSPNWYIIFVAPPGIVSKSTTANIGMKLLHQIKNDNVVFGPDSMTWQALTDSLSSAARDIPIGPNMDFHAMSCLTIVSSEFGTFLDPNDRGMVDVLVSLWDGQIGTWEHKTKTNGSTAIINPWINLIACTTPKWIAGNFPEYMIGGGFTSRCIFVYAEEKRHLQAYPGYALPSGFAKLADDLIADLEYISYLGGEMTMTPQAIEWGTDWYARHYDQLKDLPLEYSKWGGYWARKQTHVHKLAMVLSLAERDDLVVDQYHLEDAVSIITKLEPNLHKIFGLVGQSEGARLSNAVHELVATSKSLDRAAIFDRLSNTYSPKEVADSLAGLVSAGMVAATTIGGRTIYSDKIAELREYASRAQSDVAAAG